MAVTEPYTLRMSALVICIGNKARGDDGAGRLTGELLATRLAGSVMVINQPQLDITMAESISCADTVIFVDAQRRSHPAVTVEAVEAHPATDYAHALDPGGLLALAHALYGAQPEALLVSISAPEMDHQDGLSATASKAAREAANTVLELLEDRAGSNPGGRASR